MEYNKYYDTLEEDEKVEVDLLLREIVIDLSRLGIMQDIVEFNEDGVGLFEVQLKGWKVICSVSQEDIDRIISESQSPQNNLF